MTTTEYPYTRDTLRAAMLGREAARRAILDLRRSTLIIAPAEMRGTVLSTMRIYSTWMPSMTDREGAWVRAEYEGAGLLSFWPIGKMPRPFRAPHHTCSALGLLGTRERAGELQLARFGVLCLDELAEWPTMVVGRLAHALHDMKAGAPVVLATARPDGAEERARKLASILDLDILTLELS